MGTQEWGSPNSWAALWSEQRGDPFGVDVPLVVLSAGRTDPRLLNGDPFWVTYGSMQIVIYKNTEDETSHALGLVVPPVGKTSPNGWDNNRFGRELYLALRRHNVTSLPTPRQVYAYLLV